MRFRLTDMLSTDFRAWLYSAPNWRAGVIRTDFALIDHAWPPGTQSPYKFMTTAEWPDMESFRAVFYEPEMQSSLLNKLHEMDNKLFIVTEILTETRNDR